jgi:hypothetical protein
MGGSGGHGAKVATVQSSEFKGLLSTLQVTGADFTTAATTLTTITGLTFTAPANLGLNWSFHCDLVYSQASVPVANIWGIQTATTAPTNTTVGADIHTSLTGTEVNGALTDITATTTPQTIATATPGVAGTKYHAELYGTFEEPSTPSPSVLNIMVGSGSGLDTITVYRGSSCNVY